jgi:phosphonate transport system ATP-binding protein
MPREFAPQGATGLTGVSLRYAPGAPVALDGVSVEFDAGEHAAIIGPSGAGKSTLLLTLACAVRPQQGIVTVLGELPWQLSRGAVHRLRASLFHSPQTPPLPPRQRVVHAVLAGRLPQWSTWRALHSLIHPVEIDVARDALARFRVEDKLFLRCDRLSGGERQRVGLARLLTSRAQLFLVDEPVSALDPALALAALETLQAEATGRGATLVVSLHAVDLALSLFPRLIGVRAGRVMFDLPRGEVSEQLLADLYGAELGNSIQQAPADPGALLRLTRCL